MKRLVYFMLVGAFLFGCSNRTPEQKANELLSNFHLKVGDVSKLDSIVGYKEAFEKRLKADSINLAIDSFVSELVKTLSALQIMGLEHKVDSLARSAKSSALAMAQEALRLNNDASSIEFNNGIDNKPKEFLGYRFVSRNDSCVYEIYFDTHVTQILGYSRQNKKK